MAISADPKLNRAIIDLLLQMAWADHEVTAEEAKHLEDLAARAELSDSELADVRACLAGDKSLPVPDFAYLKDHKKETLLAVGKLMQKDDSIAEEEKDLFDSIKKMLG